MGVKTRRPLAFLMTLLNVRLGCWLHNPRKIGKFSKIPWWPWYHLKELMAKSGLESPRVNISDGGHIENLGVFELLRRSCRLIVALDAGADSSFSFGDLGNLVR